MNQKEKKSESQLVQLVSSLMSGVLLAFGISVLLLFCAAHLVASGTLGETIAMNAEVIASAVGCFCGGVYTALSCRKRMLLLGVVTGVVYYVAWTIIGLLCYSDVAEKLCCGSNRRRSRRISLCWPAPQKKIIAIPEMV